MAVRIRVRKLASNPHRRVRRRNRRMSAKQIKYFGSKRQKAALRAARHRKARASAPVKVRVRRPRAPTVNPALVLTLGATNPRRRSSVAKHRKRNRRHYRARNARGHFVRVRRRRVRASNPRRHYRRRRHNPARVVVRYRTRHHRRRNRRYARRSNPALFGGALTGRRTLTLVGGGLLGVAAAKFIPTIGPISSLAGGSNVMRVVVTGASAFVAGWAAGKLDATLGDAVLFGGLMQTGSVALNALLPGFRIGGIPLGLSGMAELMPGQFPVPQNPLMLPPAPPTQARITANGLARAYGTAY